MRPHLVAEVPPPQRGWGREQFPPVRGEVGIPADVECAQIGITGPRLAAPAVFNSRPRCLSTRSYRPARRPSVGCVGTIRSSRNRRHNSKSPRTIARSSGANTTARTTPRTSRTRANAVPLTRPRFARPGVISTSTRISRLLVSRLDTTAARTIVRSAPSRTPAAASKLLTGDCATWPDSRHRLDGDYTYLIMPVRLPG